MIRKWIREIRDRTMDMTIPERLAYVRQYYWYHMLILAVGIGLILLVVYHAVWGGRQPEFQCVMVNQQADWERDQALEQEFAVYAGIPPDAVSVRSDYQLSYGEVRQEGINESSYEKLFFNWAAGAIDAMLVPESFYRFCEEELGGEYRLIDEIAKDADYEKFVEKDAVYRNGDRPIGVYAAKTMLSDGISQRADDPVLLVFPKEGKHLKTSGRFLNMIARRD